MHVVHTFKFILRIVVILKLFNTPFYERRESLYVIVMYSRLSQGLHFHELGANIFPFRIHYNKERTKLWKNFQLICESLGS